MDNNSNALIENMQEDLSVPALNTEIISENQNSEDKPTVTATFEKTTLLEDQMDAEKAKVKGLEVPISEQDKKITGERVVQETLSDSEKATRRIVDQLRTGKAPDKISEGIKTASDIAKGAGVTQASTIIDAAGNVYETGNKTIEEINKAILSDAPIKTYFQKGAEGFVTGSLEFSPEIGYYATEQLPRMGETFLKFASTLAAKGYNALVSGVDYMLTETTLDGAYIDEPDLWSHNWTNWFTTPAKKAVREYIDSELKPLEQEMIARIGYVPEDQQNFIHKVGYKTGLLGANVLPFVSGFSLLFKAPKLYRGIDKIGKNNFAVAKDFGIKVAALQGKQGISSLNASLGAGAAWQIAENNLQYTPYKDIAPIMAIPGAILGATGYVTAPTKLVAGILFTMGRMFVPSTVVNSKFSKQLLAISAGVPAVKVWGANKDTLDEYIALSNPMGKKSLDDIAESLHNLPEEYKKEVINSFNSYSRLMKEFEGDSKKSDEIFFFLSQITGLSVLNSMQKANVYSAKSGTGTIHIGISEMEKMQNQLQKQRRFLEEKMISVIEENKLGNTKIEDSVINEDTFSTIMLTVKRDLQSLKKSHDELSLKMKEMFDDANVLTNFANRIELKTVADDAIDKGGFGYKANFHVSGKLDTVDYYKQQTQQIENYKNSVDTTVRDSFETSKKLNDDQWTKVTQGKENIAPLELDDLYRSISDEDITAISPLLRKLGIEGTGATAKQNMMKYGRQNTLNGLGLENLKQSINLLEENFKQGISFRSGKNPITDLDFTNLNKRIKKLQKNNATSESLELEYKNFLDKIEGIDQTSRDALNDILPATIPLNRLLEIRSSVLKEFMKHNGNTKGESLGDLLGVLTRQIDNIQDISPTLAKDYEKAKQIYKDLILPWKTSLGTQTKNMVYRPFNKYDDVLDSDHAFPQLLLAHNYETMTKMFNGMFPKGRNPIVRNGKRIDTREEAIRLFQLGIGRTLNGDYKEIKDGWIKNVTDAEVGTLFTNGMITAKQAGRLRKVVHIRTNIEEAITSEVSKARMAEVKNTIIPKMMQESGQAIVDYEKTFSRKITNADDLIDAMLSEGRMEFPVINKGAVEGFVKQLEEAVPNKNVVRGQTQFSRLVNNLPEPKQGTITDVLFDVIEKGIKKYEIDPKADGAVSPDMLSKIESLLYERIYKKSFALTPQRKITKSGYADVSKAEKPGSIGFDKLTQSGLSTDIDIVQYANLLEDMTPMLRKLSKLQDKYNPMRGGKSGETFQKILEIFEASRFAVAKNLNTDIGTVTRGWSIAAWLSRAYAVVRGVVSLRFVATEAFLRIAHKKQMEYLYRVVTNPTSVDMIHNIMVKGLPPTKAQVKSWKIIAALAIGEHARRTPDSTWVDYLQDVFGGWTGQENTDRTAQPPLKVYNANSIMITDDRKKLKNN